MHGKANHVYLPPTRVVERGNEFVVEVLEHHNFSNATVGSRKGVLVLGPYKQYNPEDPDSTRIHWAIEQAHRICQAGYEQERHAMYSVGRIALHYLGAAHTTGLKFNAVPLI